MRDAKDELESRGAKVVVVGNGQPHHAKMFAEDEGVPFTLWVDPEMKAYAAAGLRRGVRAVFNRRIVGHARSSIIAFLRSPVNEIRPPSAARIGFSSP